MNWTYEKLETIPLGFRLQTPVIYEDVPFSGNECYIVSIDNGMEFVLITNDFRLDMQVIQVSDILIAVGTAHNFYIVDILHSHEIGIVKIDFPCLSLVQLSWRFVCCVCKKNLLIYDLKKMQLAISILTEYISSYLIENENIILTLDDGKKVEYSLKEYTNSIDNEMYDPIIELYKMLDGWSSPEVQQKGIELGGKLTDLSLLIQPIHPSYNKPIWGNCAKILSNKSDDELVPYLEKLIEWVQDLNWPGSQIILDRLIAFSPQKIIPSLEISIQKAIETDDDIWLDWLSKIIENDDISKLLHEDSRNILLSHYDNNWNL